jgi:enoyl-CoA hydratase/carnithine racemase
MVPPFGSTATGTRWRERYNYAHNLNNAAHCTGRIPPGGGRVNDTTVGTAMSCDCSAGILTITLNRPDKLNAFTMAMAEELIEAFRRASADDAVRAVVVTGAGRAFCAGMDLNEASPLDHAIEPTLQDMHERIADPAFLHGVRDAGGRVALAIYSCLKPVIAAINGVAVGVGATMTLPMDARLIATGGRIGFVFGRIGLVPEACSTWFLPRLVGMAKALEWCYSAEIFDAEEALRSGLVKAIVPPEQLLDEAYRLAHRFTDGRSPMATALTRQMMYRNSAQSHPAEAHRIDSLAVFHMQKHDVPEGIQAFFDKRTPQFRSLVSKDMPSFFAPWTAGDLP